AKDGATWSGWVQLPGCASDDISPTTQAGERGVYFVGCNTKPLQRAVDHYLTSGVDGKSWSGTDVVGASLGIACPQGRPRPFITDGYRVDIVYNSCVGTADEVWDGQWELHRPVDPNNPGQCIVGTPSVSSFGPDELEVYGTACGSSPVLL